jgi:hypothetical protein
MGSSKRSRAWGRLAVAGCLVVALAGCEASMEDVIAKHRPAVEAVFAKIKVLSGPAGEVPPLAEDKIELGGAKVVLEGDASNALFVTQMDVLDPGTAGRGGPGSTHAYDIGVCGEALRGEFHGAAAGAELFMSQCGRAEYAFVLRTHAHETATVIDNESFSPGRYEGDVLLFRLADGAFLGGFPISATNGGEVSVEVGADGTPVDAATRLDSDLEAMVFSQIEEKLKANVPGVMPSEPAS